MQYTSMQHTNFALISTWVLLSQVVHCYFTLTGSDNVFLLLFLERSLLLCLLLHFGGELQTDSTDNT